MNKVNIKLTFKISNKIKCNNNLMVLNNNNNIYNHQYNLIIQLLININHLQLINHLLEINNINNNNSNYKGNNHNYNKLTNFKIQIFLGKYMMFIFRKDSNVS